MTIDKLTKDRILSIADGIKHIATNDMSHLPDKISALKTSTHLIQLEVDKLVEELEKQRKWNQ